MANPLSSYSDTSQNITLHNALGSSGKPERFETIVIGG